MKKQFDMYGIPVEVASKELKHQFAPIKSGEGGTWYMRITQSQRYSVCTIGLPMDEFLKVCRAFVADAESYK